MDVNIYLSGGMSDLSLDEQLGWRNTIINVVSRCDYLTKKPIFFNPPKYYSPSCNSHKTEKEVMEFDLYNLRKSDVVVVNFNLPNSIGTAMELMLAKEYNIPIIGINLNDVKLHPWLVECCNRIFGSFSEAIEHLINYFLIN